MLFSRVRPSMERLKTAANAQRPPPLPMTPPPMEAEIRAARCLPVIRDVKEVPTGRYTPLPERNIPAQFADSFVLLSAGESSMIVLCAVEAVGSHPYYELIRRLQEAGVRKPQIRQVSREIVRTLHDANKFTLAEATTLVEDAAWNIVNDAVEKRVSDIHIETRGSFAQVFYRIHGERIEQNSISSSTATEICNVLYTVHADGDNKGVSWDPKTVQNTIVEHETTSGTKVQLRFSSSPIHPSNNFHAVIRLLVQNDETIRPLEDIGYTSAQVQTIEEMLVGAQGMVVLVGPTNSGKSTSMQSFAQRIYDRRGKSIKVLTVEDPVEYIMPHACQMGVPERRKSLQDHTNGSIFTTFLKGTLRQDPDVVMVGEIRDTDSADSVKQLVLAGRKLLTTLHVYEAFAVFARLRELGVPESVLFMQGFVSGVIYQRLVPELCPKCSLPIAQALNEGRIRQATFDRVARVSDLAADDIRVRGVGCDRCKHLGIIGRTPCAALLVPDATLLGLMAQGNEIAARQYWLSNKSLDVGGLGVSAVAHAIQKMRQGRLDPSDVESQIGALTPELGSAVTTGIPVGSDFPPSLQF